MNKAILTYGASHEDIDSRYKEAAEQTGRLIAESGYDLVNGGGKAGLMRASIDGALSAGGRTVGVLPEFMVRRGWQHPGLSEMIIASDMHDRKTRMASLASAVIAFPGGCGTLEELLEIITWRKLGLFSGPVVILNTLGFYDPLITMLEKAIESNFMFPAHRRLWQVASTPEEAVRMATVPSSDISFPQTIS